MKRTPVLMGLAALLSAATAASQTVVTGEKVLDEIEYRSPMTVEVPFALSDPARWNGTWTSGKEYPELREFRCEKVFIESLKMRARRVEQTNVEVAIQPKLRNPNGSHDKRVWLTVELLNDGTPINKVARPKTAAEKSLEKEKTRLFPGDEAGGIDLEESDSATRTISMTVLADDLRSSTVLRITIALRDENR